MRSERLTGLLLNLALAGLTLVVSLALAAGALTLISVRRLRSDTTFHDPNTRFDPQLGWAPVPSRSIVTWKQTRVSSNRAGFRSPEVDEAKGHILIVGDSVVWGYKVNDDETVSRYLQDLVDAKRSDLQVLNLGVSGYGIDQYYLWLRRNLERISSPRAIVVVITTSNDWANTIANHAYGKSKPLFTVDPAGGLRNLNERVSEYSVMNLTSQWNLPRRWQTFLQRSSGAREITDEELRAVVARLLAEMEKLAASRNARLLFVLAPHLGNLGAQESDGWRAFRQLFAERGHEVLDFKEFLVRNEPKRRQAFRDGVHFSPLGHRRLAEAIFERLGLENL